MRSTFHPCLPTVGKVDPAIHNWLHEVKYDGYRLIVARGGDRVRLYAQQRRLDRPLLPLDCRERA
jgi:ATP-dependent DNA ligase